MEKEKIIKIFLLLCIIAFVLGYFIGLNDKTERALFAATAMANETGQPVLAYRSTDGNQRWQLPMKVDPEVARAIAEKEKKEARRRYAEKLIKAAVYKNEKIWAKRQKFLKKWAPDVIRKVETEYGDLIASVSQAERVKKERVVAKVSLESGGDPYAVSASGAEGSMQLMPKTSEILGVNNPFDPMENIPAGTRYFRQLVDKFGSVDAAMAAYNLGETNVRLMMEYGFNPSEARYVRDIKYIMVIAKSVKK